MLWLIFQFYKIFFNFFKLKNQLMIENIFQIFLKKNLTKINENTLIE